MRVLLASDLHYSLPQMDFLVDQASAFDLVVLAGDHLDVSSHVPLDAQSVVVMEYFDLLAAVTRLVVSSGNHDLTGPDANGEQSALWLSEVRERGITTDGDSLVVGDTLVTVCPWWDGPLGREILADQLASDAARRRARWVWVYHWPPPDSPTSWTGQRFYGDPDLDAWITEHAPDIVLTGHVHQPPFRPDGGWAERRGTTWVFNAGHQSGPVPAHIELDLVDGFGTATWRSLMGSEEIDLSSTRAPARSLF